MANDRGDKNQEKLEDAFQQVLLDLATGFINVSLDSFDAAINEMLSRVGHFTELDRAYLFQHDHRRRVTSNTHEWCAVGVNPEIDNLQDVPFDYFMDMLAIWERGQYVHIPKVSQMSEKDPMKNILAEQSIKSLVLIPLLYGNSNIGFVGFDAVKKARDFTEKEISLLKVLSEIISNSLARKQADLLLRDSEEKYRYLAENMSDIMWVTDLELNKTYVSPSVEATLGFTREEAEKQSLQETVTSGSYQYAMEVFAREFEPISTGIIENSFSVLLEMEFYHKNGSTLWMEVNCKPYLDEAGRLAGIYGVSRDISERKKAEAALKESEDKFRGFVENSHDIIYMLNDKGVFTYASPSWKELLGHDIEEVEGRSFTDFVYEEDLARCLEFQMKILQNEYQEESLAYRVKHKDGSLRWHDSNGSLLDRNGKYIYIGVARDVTEQKHIEMALRESEEKFRLLAENMSDIVWIMGTDLKRTYVSPSVETVLGFTPEESMQQSLEETILPDSIGYVADVFTRELEKTQISGFDPNHSAIIEAEYYHKHESPVWLESNCKPMFDEKGNLVGIYGVSRDITERKKTAQIINEEKAFQEVLLKLSTGFINVPLEKFDIAINKMLEEVGTFTSVDRVYLFQHDASQVSTSNTHEWCARGIKPSIDRLENIPLAKHKEMLSILQSGEIIHLPDIGQVSKDNSILPVIQEHDIKSLVFIPLLHKKENIGFVGFDAVKEKRTFSSREINLLIVLAEIISNALSRKHSEELLLVQQMQLASWNQELEQKILERTQAIKNLLDNAGQGFLTINQNFIVDNEYSLECESILGKNIAGRNILYLLFPWNKEDREIFEEIVLQVCVEIDPDKRRVYMSLLPAEVLIGERNIALSYKLIHNNLNDHKKAQIMLILTDITDKRELEAHLHEERKLFEMVVRVVSNHVDFNATLSEYKYYCYNCCSEIDDAIDPMQSFARVYRSIHTFKGEFHQFGMLNTVDCLHELENKLIQFQHQSPEQLTKEKLKKILAEEDMKNWINADLELLKKFLGNSLFLQDSTLLINAEKLQELEKRIVGTLSPPEMQLLLQEIKKISWKPFRDSLTAYPEYIKRLSNQMEKMVYPLRIEGGEMPVDPDRYRDFIKTLGHVFRNAVGHGIESPDIRIAAGKDERGSIKCRVHENNSQIIVEIEDDGCGLPLSNPGEDINRLIFEDQFTTKQNACNLSGRGMGLAAVKSEVDKLGGSIDVKSVSKKGTVFTFHLPLEVNVLTKAVLPFEAISIFLRTAKSYLNDEAGLAFYSTIKNNFAIAGSTQMLRFTSIINVRGLICGKILMTIDKRLCEHIIKNDNSHIVNQDKDVNKQVSKKVLKNIVEYFKQSLPGGDLLIVEKPEIIESENGFIESDIGDLLKYELEFREGCLAFAFIPGKDSGMMITPEQAQSFDIMGI